MKIRKIYKISALLALYVLLQGRSTGPGSTGNLQVTGAPGSTGNPGTCANGGCHDDGQFDAATNILLLEGTDTVTAYEPGKTYTLQVFGLGTGAARFGFQAVALDAGDVQAGTWGSPGSGKKITTLGGRKYLEHSTPSSTGLFEAPWEAPATGTGPVSFYAATAAVNNNGNANGDGAANAVLTIAEAETNTAEGVAAPGGSLLAFPNPAHTQTSLLVETSSAGTYRLQVIDHRGSLLHEQSVPLTAGVQSFPLNLEDLPAGWYTVRMLGRRNVLTTRLIRR
ncbi:MAG: hypothetical protein RLY31_846 [Bacteroidota bacterium]|jgi:hypothetical protein